MKNEKEKIFIDILRNSTPTRKNNYFDYGKDKLYSFVILWTIFFLSLQDENSNDFK